MTAAILLRLLLSLLVAAALAAWLWRNRGARRDRAGVGTADGLLLLGALAFGAMSLVLGATAVYRVRDAARVQREWRRADAELWGCRTERFRRSGRSGSTAYGATCTLRWLADGRPIEHGATLGYPGSRAPVDRWVAAHPNGGRESIYYDPTHPDRIWGFGRESGFSSTTPDAAASGSATFATVAALLFAASRWVVARRKRAPAAPAPAV